MTKQPPRTLKSTARPASPPIVNFSDDARALHPDYFYRLIDGHKFFGYGHSSMATKIKTGEVPTPISLSDTGRARGWFGRTIIAWQKQREEKAAAKAGGTS